MKFFLFSLMLPIFFQNVYANDFTQKKLIKIYRENYEIIELKDQINDELNKQIWDTKFENNQEFIVWLRGKKFVILTTFTPYYGFVLKDFKKSAYHFSKDLVESVITQLDAKKHKDFQYSLLYDARWFMKNQKQSIKNFIKQADYIIVINLDDFYIEITNYMLFDIKTVKTKLNYSIIDAKNQKIKQNRNLGIDFKIGESSQEKDYQKTLELLSKTISEEILTHSDKILK
ncbi:hypothetical protein [Campylobacter sp. CCS1377]|uniref:Periplasmic protein n=1 Tax=Campylobacter sp. CCS1377 TaxID=3158229 RepID=A0AAU7E639_9BACT